MFFKFLISQKYVPFNYVHSSSGSFCNLMYEIGEIRHLMAFWNFRAMMDCDC